MEDSGSWLSLSKRIYVQIKVTKDIVCQSQTQMEPTAYLNVSQEFAYAIDGRKEDNQGKEIQLNQTIAYEFEHKYMLWNTGPSPTDQPVHFSIFVPGLVAENSIHPRHEKNMDAPIISINPKIPKIECNEPRNSTRLLIKPEQDKRNEISCKTLECLVYDCKAFHGWKKGHGNAKSIHIELNFDPQSFLQTEFRHVREFFISTAIEVKDNDGDKTYITYSTKFVSNLSGNWKAEIAESWPIFVGAFIVIMIFASVLYGLHKTISLRRLRIYRIDHMYNGRPGKKSASVYISSHSFNCDTH